MNFSRDTFGQCSEMVHFRWIQRVEEPSGPQEENTALGAITSHWRNIHCMHTFSLKPVKVGLELIVRGYSANQPIFLRRILSTLFSMEAADFAMSSDDGSSTVPKSSESIFCADRFSEVRRQHERGLESAEADALKSQAGRLLLGVLCPRGHFTRRQRLTALRRLTPACVRRHAASLFSLASAECLFYGNVDRAAAAQMAADIAEQRAAFAEKVSAAITPAASKLPAQMLAHLDEDFVKQPEQRIAFAVEALEPALLPPKQAHSKTWKQRNGTTGADTTEEKKEETECEKTNTSEKDEYLVPFTHPNQEFQLPLTTSSLGHVILVHNEVHSSSCVLMLLQLGLDTPWLTARAETFAGAARAKLMGALRKKVLAMYC